MDRKKIGIILIAWTVVISYTYVNNIQDRRTKVEIELPEQKPVATKPWGDVDFTRKDEKCLALNIYFESRGEKSTRGKYAVADVVMYRMINAKYPDEVCDIIKDGPQHRNALPVRHQCQFSWWCDGKRDVPKDEDAFEEAIDIAQEVLYDDDYVPKIEYAIHYHAKHVRPHWSHKREFVEQIGNHRFYR
jgi:spore germination cell wall hydrolase CwlJ-like protein